MNQITPARSNYGPPAPASAELGRKIDEISGRVGWFGKVPRLIDCEVGPKTIAELRGRLAEIDAALAQRDQRRVQDALYQIFAITKLNRDDAGSIDDLVQVYSAFLGNLPVWAVVEACAIIARSGEKFAPAAPEVHARAKDVIAGVMRERSKIEAILQAAEHSGPQRMPPDADRRKAQVEAALASLGIDPATPDADSRAA